MLSKRAGESILICRVVTISRYVIYYHAVRVSTANCWRAAYVTYALLPRYTLRQQ